MDCTSSAPSHGTTTGTDTGRIGCLGGSSTAALAVAWEAGQTIGQAPARLPLPRTGSLAPTRLDSPP
jgi:hypothetical protein